MVRRLLLGALALVVVLGGLAWTYQVELVLWGVERMANRGEIAPHREIDWASGADPAGRSPAQRPPNVVLILADDLGYNDVSLHGGGMAGGSVTTPNIDSIARDGVEFTNGYAAHSSCAPSRAALMSGRYGTRFGFEFTPAPSVMGPVIRVVMSSMPGRIRQPVRVPVESDGPELEYANIGMPPSEITLAELLAERGYHSVHIGKWHLGRANGMGPHDQGFDESLLMASGLYGRKDDPDVVGARLDFDPIDMFLWRALRFAASFNGGEVFEPGGYLTDYWTDEAVKVIDANKDRPFFLYLAHWAPHTPLQATREDYEALAHIPEHRERVYAGMIRALDRSVGRVLGALREHGLEENTLVMFTSDNGGAHYIGIPSVNEPYRGWKLTFFEGGIHVPYYIKWPARIPAGRTVREPVHGFDLYATAAAAAGAPLPGDRKMDGVDLVPFARGERGGAPHDELFWRAGHYQVALADGWKLQVNERVGRTWLHDLNTDPTEQINLAERHPERVAWLKALLEAHNAEQATPAWPSRGELPVNIDKALHIPDAPDDVHIYVPN